MAQQPNSENNTTRPLVALLDGRDCSVEMPLLKDIATVAFCDAQLTTEIHEKVLNEAVAALLYSIRLSREDLVKFRSLKLIVKIGSPDMPNLDILAATQLGIAVCNTPVESIEEIADHTISLILNMYRRTYWMAKAAQTAGRNTNTAEQLRELMNGVRRIRGSTLGLIGFGRVGCAVALRAKALGFNVCYHDPNSATEGMDRVFGVQHAETLTELLVQSDCITLHCQLNAETRNILDNEAFKKVKSGAFLINTSAADLIDFDALLSALKFGNVKAAALDMLPTQQWESMTNNSLLQEQTNFYDALSSMPNVIITPKCAWFSEDSLKEMRIAAAKEVRRALKGQIPVPECLQNCVNKQELLALCLANLRPETNMQFAAENVDCGQLGGLNYCANFVDGRQKMFENNSNIIHHQMNHNAQMNMQLQNLKGISSQFPIERIPVTADSANNTFSAYQNFMLHNPQLLMTLAAANPITHPHHSSIAHLLPTSAAYNPIIRPTNEEIVGTSNAQEKHSSSNMSSPPSKITSNSSPIPHADNIITSTTLASKANSIKKKEGNNDDNRIDEPIENNSLNNACDSERLEQDNHISDAQAENGSKLLQPQSPTQQHSKCTSPEVI